MTSIDQVNNVNVAKPAVTNAQAEVEKPVDNKPISTQNKVLIGVAGALALAGTVLGGIKYHKNVKFNKAFEGAKSSLERVIKDVKEDEIIKSKFDLSKIDEEIASTLNKAQETKDLEGIYKLEKLYFDTRNDFTIKHPWGKDYLQTNLEHLLNKGNTDRVKELQKIVDEKGDFIKARDLFVKEFRTFFQQRNTTYNIAKGMNIQETLDLYVKKGLLPKGIKPHNYDLSKELDLVVCFNNGGFKEYMVRQEGKLVEYSSMYTDNCISPYNINTTRYKDKRYNAFVSTFNDSKKQIVSLEIPDVGNNKTPIFIGIASKDGALTPLQKDLIEVGGRLKPEEMKAFNKLLHWNNLTKETYLDYDAILSLIQHYKNDADFMARAVK